MLRLRSWFMLLVLALAIFALSIAVPTRTDAQRVDESVRVRGLVNSFAALSSVASTTSLQTAGNTNHSMQFVVTGTPATCTLDLEGSNDVGATWFDLINNTTCTAASGISFVADRPADYVRATLDALTGVSATLTTALTGANNDVVFTAATAGTVGNSVTVRYVDPAGNNAALGVVVVGTAVTVNLATNGGGTITTTAAQLKTAWDGSAPALALATVANAGGNDGSGVVTAMSVLPLAGGTAPTVTVHYSGTQ